MPHCKTCRFWSQRRTCDLIGLTDDTDDTSAPAFAGIAVTVSDDHNLNAELLTGPLFGCIRHEVLPNA